MSVSRARLLKSLSLPVFAALVVPSILLALFPPGPVQYLAPRFVLGMLLISVGFGLLVTCISLFAVVGDGTLAPWDPPRKLVVRGPYRHTRNPMLSGVNFIVFGEGVLLGSWPLFAWGAFFVALNTAYFVRSEEPALARRFGPGLRAVQGSSAQMARATGSVDRRVHDIVTFSSAAHTSLAASSRISNPATDKAADIGHPMCSRVGTVRLRASARSGSVYLVHLRVHGMREPRRLCPRESRCAFRPAARSREAISASSNTLRTASAKPGTSPNRYQHPRVPHNLRHARSISRHTGVPQAIASSGVSPKPSYRDGNAYTAAPA